MRKRFWFIVFIFVGWILMLTSCTSHIYLDRPEDTNLSLWITERPSNMELNKCTFIPGGFGCSIYLDARYNLTEEEVPDIHITYTLSGYPDTSDKYAVTSIHITDPSIYVYGLTMSSLKEEIASVMEANKFKEKTEENGEKSYIKNNVRFVFRSTEISIFASSTNKHHIDY